MGCVFRWYVYFILFNLVIIQLLDHKRITGLLAYDSILVQIWFSTYVKTAHNATQIAEIICIIVIKWCIKIGLLYHGYNTTSIFNFNIKQILLF